MRHTLKHSKKNRALDCDKTDGESQVSDKISNFGDTVQHLIFLLSSDSEPGVPEKKHQLYYHKMFLVI